ncbi:NAD(P)/FAD-dependent oxidoreductase [Mycobacterium sp. SMC-4]|uniref:NAD(P)/FAD-dependent oxidoreductase n=1 Tax=Mycobacterium sp. SMC-4 TaxID=2857059 RepID=UPI0021B2403A|nr:FAD/NAD(P)-binding oxidoreductase [Mycobacterium sp. SMC-4]UXA17999.1 NAD(P)/FAD-dependent oxidoreductase [Mycobacterium sp. SMC-4]
MSHGDRHFDVVILGGGNAGISAAARLIRAGLRDVAVIEPQTVHTYRPLLSYVGGGQADLSAAERTQRSVTPRECTWIRDHALAVDADRATVHCDSGRTYRYTDLIVGTGLVPDTAELPGIDTAIQAPTVTSNYLDHAEKTWRLVRALPPGGRAVFTVPRPPVSCTGTTVKPLFLAADHWRRTGRQTALDLTLVVDRPSLLGITEIDSRVSEALQQLGVRVRYDSRVETVDVDAGELTIASSGAAETLDFDLLHIVPPFRGPSWVHESGLAGQNPHGLVDIDAGTLRHRSRPDVWAAGDGAAVDTDPSGGALRRQIATLVHNLLAARRGQALAHYDGYSVAPITTDARHLIAGEFYRSGAIASSLPSFVDSTKPRRSAWVFDRYILPRLYWRQILKGRL